MIKIKSRILGLAVGVVFLAALGSAFAQVPPASTLCAIVPSLCQGGGGPPPPPPPSDEINYDLSKEVLSPPDLTVEEDEEVTYEIKVVKNDPPETAGNKLKVIDYLPGQLDPVDPTSLTWENLPDSQDEVKLTLKARVKADACDKFDDDRIFYNRASWQYDGNPPSAPVTSKQALTLFCPEPFGVKGDVGATQAGITNAVKVIGPALSASSTLTNSASVEGVVNKIYSYLFEDKVKNLTGSFTDSFQKLTAETPSNINSNNCPDINSITPTHRPGGEVWKYSSDSALKLCSVVSGSGTIIVLTSALELAAGFGGTSGGGNETLGIAVLGDKAVDISSNSVHNVGLYTPNSTVTIKDAPIDWEGFIVARKIIVEPSEQPRRIAWTLDLSKTPPPGFSRLIGDILKVSEQAPE